MALRSGLAAKLCWEAFPGLTGPGSPNSWIRSQTSLWRRTGGCLVSTLYQMLVFFCSKNEWMKSEFLPFFIRFNSEEWRLQSLSSWVCSVAWGLATRRIQCFWWTWCRRGPNIFWISKDMVLYLNIQKKFTMGIIIWIYKDMVSVSLPGSLNGGLLAGICNEQLSRMNLLRAKLGMSTILGSMTMRSRFNLLLRQWLAGRWRNGGTKAWKPVPTPVPMPLSWKTHHSWNCFQFPRRKRWFRISTQINWYHNFQHFRDKLCLKW